MTRRSRRELERAVENLDPDTGAEFVNLWKRSADAGAELTPEERKRFNELWRRERTAAGLEDDADRGERP